MQYNKPFTQCYQFYLRNSPTLQHCPQLFLCGLCSRVTFPMKLYKIWPKPASPASSLRLDHTCREHIYHSFLFLHFQCLKMFTKYTSQDKHLMKRKVFFYMTCFRGHLTSEYKIKNKLSDCKGHAPSLVHF